MAEFRARVRGSEIAVRARSVDAHDLVPLRGRTGERGPPRTAIGIPQLWRHRTEYPHAASERSIQARTSPREPPWPALNDSPRVVTTEVARFEANMR